MNVEVKSIAEHGLPDMDKLTGRVAFIFDGCIVSGWPLANLGHPDDEWEADSDVGQRGYFSGVEYYIIFPFALHDKGKLKESISTPPII